jgi:SAM-dependent methyltransferase
VTKWLNAQRLELEHWQSAIAMPVHSRAALTNAAVVSYVIWTRFGVCLADCIGGTIIDIGCGPTGRIACFGGAKKIGIDPLADEYRKLAPVLMNDYAAIYQARAEEFLPCLAESAYLVACINCLDHCEYPRDVIANMYAYCKPGGIGVVSVDCSDGPEEMHPSRTTPESVAALLVDVGWKIEHASSGKAYPHLNDAGEVVAWDDGWSPSAVAYHWKVRRQSES